MTQFERRISPRFPALSSAEGLVKEQQAGITGLEPAERIVDRLLRLLIAVIGKP
jgi:hypothetical protein